MKVKRRQFSICGSWRRAKKAKTAAAASVKGFNALFNCPARSGGGIESGWLRMRWIIAGARSIDTTRFGTADVVIVSRAACAVTLAAVVRVRRSMG